MIRGDRCRLEKTAEIFYDRGARQCSGLAGTNCVIVKVRIKVTYGSTTKYEGYKYTDMVYLGNIKDVNNRWRIFRVDNLHLSFSQTYKISVNYLGFILNDGIIGQNGPGASYCYVNFIEVSES